MQGVASRNTCLVQVGRERGRHRAGRHLHRLVGVDRLRLDDRGKSALTGEVRRSGVGDDAWTGVRGVALRKGDRVVTMEVLAKDGTILTVAERGFGKRTDLEEYRLQARGGMGIINLKVTAKTGNVVGVKQVRDEDNLMLITQSGQIIRIHVGDIRVIGRSTQGVKVMDLEGEDRLVAIAKVAERDNGEGEAEEGGPAGELPEPPEPSEPPVN